VRQQSAWHEEGNKTNGGQSHLTFWLNNRDLDSEKGVPHQCKMKIEMSPLAIAYQLASDLVNHAVCQKTNSGTYLN
jgi:hypothetical protein